MNIALISLGCDKNQINAEQMLCKLREAGHEIADVGEAEAVLINTCGFIESAKSEAIEAILEVAELKADRGGNVRFLAVSGCLAERYREEIFGELPEVDGLLGCGRFDDVADLFREIARGEKPALFGNLDAPVSETPRERTGHAHTAYLKIAEGCGNRCAYCVIPKLRGRYRSRPMDAVLREAEALVAEGVKELILVAQDVTAYGTDWGGAPELPSLLDRICGIDGLEWIRLHYLYPERMTDELIDTIQRQEKVLRYFDIPIQHVSDAILRRMNRRSTKAGIDGLFRTIRRKLPDAVLRTSIICGLPGEGEAEFAELCEFLREHKLERAGFFAFSPEEGTPAFEMPGAPDEETVSNRLDILTGLQSRVLDEWNDARAGTVMRALIDGFSSETGHYLGRTYADSPDIDPGILVRAKEPLLVGNFYNVRVTGKENDRLIGEA